MLGMMALNDALSADPFGLAGECRRIEGRCLGHAVQLVHPEHRFGGRCLVPGLLRSKKEVDIPGGPIQAELGFISSA